MRKLACAYYLLLAAIIFCQSCAKVDEHSDTNDANIDEVTEFSSIEGNVKRKNFINSYIDVNDITVEKFDNQQSVFPMIVVSTDGHRYSVNSDRHKQISEQIGDTCYYRYSDPSYEVVNDEICDIDIICVEAFDDEHQEGASLSNITTVVMASPYNYVKNGYKDDSKQDDSKTLAEYLEYNGIYFLPHYEAKCVKMKDLNQCETIYFAPQLFIIFDKLPSKKGFYSFNVMLDLSDNKLKKMVKMNFN